MRMLVLVLLLIASPVRAESYRVGGLLPDLTFRMVDDHGRAVSEQTFRGQAVALYFGYTGCGDTCPLSLTRLAEAVRGMGPEAAKVRVLFVTVTPETDTPAVLEAYLHGYGCGCMTGLTGRGGENLAHRLRAAWPVMSGGPPVHGTAIYVFDGDGRATSLVTADSDAHDLATAIKAALHERP